MKLNIYFVAIFIAPLTAVFIGCSSSEKSTTTSANVPPAVQQPNEPATKEIVDPAKQSNSTPTKLPDPVQETPQHQQLLPYGKFGVQIGAYTSLENAELAAASAKSRFSRNVYTINDKTQNLYKVMIGEFATKDEARQFRDRIVQQYPGEYNDAWVSEYIR
jgi:cell division septation protein DedD